jgi:hypothetical protein
MSDYQKTIKVHYKADHDPKVWFSPDEGDVVMKKKGKIVFKKADNSSDFTFTGIHIDPPSDQFAVESIQPHRLTVADSDAQAGTYTYCVDLQTAAGPVTSDPEIINKPQ